LECEYVQEIYPVSSVDNERGMQLRIDPAKLEYSYDEAVQLGAVPKKPDQSINYSNGHKTTPDEYNAYNSGNLVT
jgi:hypothetical protein